MRNGEASHATRAVRTGTVGGVVIGGDYQGLGIVRSLGRHGIPICVVDDELSIAKFSRYTDHAIHVRDLRDPDACVESLLEIGRKLNLSGWVLYPTRDETVSALAKHRSRLSQFFRVPTPEASTTKWATDKRNTYELAQRLGIPTPMTWYPDSVEDLHVIDGSFPMVLKPAMKQQFVHTTHAKAWRVDTRQHLVERFLEAAAITGGDAMMVQELIPGDGRQQFAFCSFFSGGVSLARMAVRRWRQHPPEFGRASTFVQTITYPELAATSERFLRAIDYYGLVELEYKRDPRDGAVKLLDVNARTWGYHSLGYGAGVDFPYLLFRDQVGERLIGLHEATPGVRWVRLVTDLPTAVVDRSVSWRRYLHSLRGVETEAVFSRHDPLPAVAELGLIPYLYMKRGF